MTHPDAFPLPAADQTAPSTAGPRRRRSWIGRLLKMVVVLLIMAVGLLSVEVISSGTSPREVIRQLARLITSQDRLLRGEAEGRINLLILGIGGTGHEGPLLTDTMVVVSLRLTPPAVAIISIPRDLLVAVPGFGHRRVNTAYALTEVNQPGQGIAVATSLIRQIFDLPIHYYGVIDFTGFQQLVDTVGGVTVKVEHPIDDEFYPVTGQAMATSSQRFEHVIIPAGSHHFDGALALKYVRSRKAKGLQGSDFARSHRQQQVMLALVDRLGSLGIFQPGRPGEVLRTLTTHGQTDLELWEILRLYQLGKSVPESQIVPHVLDDRPQGFLSAKNFDGAYLLVPKTGDFSELQHLARDPFTPLGVTGAWGNSVGITSTRETLPAAPSPSPSPLPARVQIHNGTAVAGLAAATERYLRAQGYAVVAVGNAPRQTYLKTVIYNLRPPAHGPEVHALSLLLNAITFESGVPTPIVRDGHDSPYPLDPEADVLIILGQDATGIIPKIQNGYPG